MRSRLRPRRPKWTTRGPGWLLLYRIGVGTLGGLVLAVGIVLIPYPGPGWLIVFAGLAILAHEFPWARKVLTFLRRRYDAWRAWLSRRGLVIKLLVYLFTLAVVLATIWLLGGAAVVGRLAGLDWPWLRSPIFG